jgi:hypothetical protein
MLVQQLPTRHLNPWLPLHVAHRRLLRAHRHLLRAHRRLLHAHRRLAVLTEL